MPQLLLMRHGKAVQGDAVADRERALTRRGVRDTERIARLIAREFPPDRILCSPALRTRQTLAAITPVIGKVRDAIFVEDLYDAPGDYLAVLSANADAAERLLLIGHNPAVQQTAVTLTGGGERVLRAELREKFPTSAVAVIAFARPWSEVEPLSGSLVAFLTP